MSLTAFLTFPVWAWLATTALQVVILALFAILSTGFNMQRFSYAENFSYLAIGLT